MAGVRASELKQLRKSPAHMKYYRDNQITSASTQIGTLVHKLFLEPDSVNNLVMRPKDADGKPLNGNTKLYKDWKKELEATDQTEVTQKELDIVSQILESLNYSPDVLMLRESFSGTEQVFRWTEKVEYKDYGTREVICKAKIDALSSFALIEVKTTSDSSPRAFTRQAYEMGYHIQAYHYLKAVREAGHDVNYVFFIVVENTPPFITTVFTASREFLEAGAKEWNQLINLYVECEELKTYKGYTDVLQSLSLPDWVLKTLF